MKASFGAFTEQFSGKAFIVYSYDGGVANPDVIPEIAAEIERLKSVINEQRASALQATSMFIAH